MSWDTFPRSGHEVRREALDRMLILNQRLLESQAVAA